MNNILPFISQSKLGAQKQIAFFIEWAKTTLLKGVPNQVYDGVHWEAESWHPWGIKGGSFYAFEVEKQFSRKDKSLIQKPFLDFVKAVIVYRYIFQNKRCIHTYLSALKVLEFAMLEITGERDVTQINAAVCDKASNMMLSKWPNGDAAYSYSNALEQIVDLMKAHKMLAKPFRWTSKLPKIRVGTLKQQRLNRENKLPSRDSLVALGEIFNNKLTSPLDIVVSSACAILLSQPSRVGELADLPLDCIVYKSNPNGGERMFLRWFSEKGYGATLKPVMTGMEDTVERAVTLMKDLTKDAREYAAWLEDNPDQFPMHEGVPKKNQEEPLSYSEICSALMIAVPKNHTARNKFKIVYLDKLERRTSLSPKARSIINQIRSGWDTSDGKPVYHDGKFVCYEYNDQPINLSMLNTLLREKYLPKHFPYTTKFEDGKNRIKYRDALFTVKTGFLRDATRNSCTMHHMVGVEIGATASRIGIQLSGKSHVVSIFERHGYPCVSVNTHAFRHELNTQMHRAGLSQLLIDTFSGRTSMGSVYNHETVEERTQALIAVHPSTKHSINSNRLNSMTTNTPLSLSQVVELDENTPDRIIHKTHIGICVHDFSYSPCPKMGACLTCGMLGCIKGDDVKLANLKEEQKALNLNYNKSVDAELKGYFGASQWRVKAEFDLLKCNALIKLLEDPSLENGDIVWNKDNGWNLTKNAAVMSGLIKLKDIHFEEKIPSLGELEALMKQLDD